MKTITNVGQYSTVKMPDFFLPAVIETNRKSSKDNKSITDKELRRVHVHFGKNMDILVCVAEGRKLEGMDLERVELLIGAR